MTDANCFVEVSGSTVSSMTALADAVNSASPGDQILIAQGNYSGGTIIFNRDGAAGNPIVIRPSSGTVNISNVDWIVANTSSHLVFSRLNITGGRIQLMGDHNRITRCRLNNVGIRMTTARDCRIDHLECVGGRTPIDYRGAASYGSQSAARNLIDHCYFHDYSAQVIDCFGDGGVPSLGTDVPRGRSITVDTCLFHNCTNAGEFVLLKVGGMIWRNCTFTACRGYFQVRVGGHCEVRSCWFENVTNRYFGKDHLIIGNRYTGSDNLWLPCGDADYDVAVANGVGALYMAAEACQVIGNRLDQGRILVGTYWADAAAPNPNTPARNNVLAANTRGEPPGSGGNAHRFENGSPANPLSPGQVSATVNSTTSMPFTPAVKLTTANVGLNAPDTFCP